MGKALRVSISTFFAAVVTFSLFLLMVQLIVVDHSFSSLGRVDMQFAVKATLPSEIVEPPKQLPDPPEVEQLQEPPRLTPMIATQMTSEPVTIPVVIPSLEPADSEPVLLGKFPGHAGATEPGESGIVPLTTFAPVYPLDAAINKIEGHVLVAFTINEFGRVAEVEILESQPPRVFDAAARKAIMKWTFKPRQLDGTAVTRRAKQRLTFTLDD